MMVARHFLYPGPSPHVTRADSALLLSISVPGEGLNHPLPAWPHMWRLGARELNRQNCNEIMTNPHPGTEISIYC